MRNKKNIMSIPEIAKNIFGDNYILALRYRDWLAEEAAVRGLIGPREIDRLWDRHIINCAVVEEMFKYGESVVDLGSGAGLPGVPIAIARPDLEVVLLEPSLRRTAFLSEVVEDLNLSNVTVVRGRAEDKDIVTDYNESDAVTSRAVASLDKLSQWSAPLIRVDGNFIAIKGCTADAEIIEHKSVCNSHGITDLRIKKISASSLVEDTTLIVGRKTAESSPKPRRSSHNLNVAQNS